MKSLSRHLALPFPKARVPAFFSRSAQANDVHRPSGLFQNPIGDLTMMGLLLPTHDGAEDFPRTKALEAMNNFTHRAASTDARARQALVRKSTLRRLMALSCIALFAAPPTLLFGISHMSSQTASALGRPPRAWGSADVRPLLPLLSGLKRWHTTKLVVRRGDARRNPPQSRALPNPIDHLTDSGLDWCRCPSFSCGPTIPAFQ